MEISPFCPPPTPALQPYQLTAPRQPGTQKMLIKLKCLALWQLLNIYKTRGPCTPEAFILVGKAKADAMPKE